MKSVLFFALGLVLAVPALPCKGDDATAGAPHGPVDYQGNLAKIPATDPPATDAPQLLAAIKGVHPRLLYTAAEIDALKLAIPTNPILKRCLDDNLLWIKRFKGVPQSQVDAMVRDDTATLATAMENYAALGLVYSLNHDPAVKRMIVDLLTRMIAEPYWADTQELDSIWERRTTCSWSPCCSTRSTRISIPLSAPRWPTRCSSTHAGSTISDTGNWRLVWRNIGSKTPSRITAGTATRASSARCSPLMANRDAIPITSWNRPARKWTS
jgi:hypothetical protein